MLVPSHILSSRTGFQTQGFLNPKFRIGLPNCFFIHFLYWIPFLCFLWKQWFPRICSWPFLYPNTFFLDNTIFWYNVNSHIALVLLFLWVSQHISSCFLGFPWLLECHIDTSEKHMLTVRFEKDIRIFRHLVMHLWNEWARVVVFKFSFWAEDHLLFQTKFYVKQIYSYINALKSEGLWVNRKWEA